MSMGLTIDEATAQKRLKGFAERPAWKNLAAVKSERDICRGSRQPPGT